MVKTLLIVLLSLPFVAGCASVKYSKTALDGSKVNFSNVSLFSNSALKGLSVESQTKTTTNGLRITSTMTEPNPESITATGSALGELIGTAAKAAAK
jgi:hypothetical protein